MRATHMLELPLVHLREQVGQCAPGDFATVFGRLLEEYARRQGRPRWGEKSPYSYRWAKDMMKWFPAATFVHIIRDPRDVAASLRDVRFTDGLHYWFTTSPAVVGLEWRESTNVAEQLQKSCPSRYRALRYEDLVTQPEETVRALCKFVDEEFLPEILDVTNRLPFGDSNSSFEQLQGISRNPIGRGRERLGPAELWWLERFAGSGLGRWGYDATRTGWTLEAGLRTPTVALQASMFGLLRTARSLAPACFERQAVLTPASDETKPS